MMGLRNVKRMLVVDGEEINDAYQKKTSTTDNICVILFGDEYESGDYKRINLAESMLDAVENINDGYEPEWYQEVLNICKFMADECGLPMNEDVLVEVCW